MRLYVLTLISGILGIKQTNIVNADKREKPYGFICTYGFLKTERSKLTADKQGRHLGRR